MVCFDSTFWWIHAAPPLPISQFKDYSEIALGKTYIFCSTGSLAVKWTPLIRFPCSSRISTHRGRSLGISVKSRRLQSTIDPKQSHSWGQAVKVVSSRPDTSFRHKLEQIRRKRLNVEFFIWTLSYALKSKKGISRVGMEAIRTFFSIIFDHLHAARHPKVLFLKFSQRQIATRS